jgi:DNA repair ATPase RecN|tara:strand:+ start:331 stop:975 length:645 start_codon:yes stop_codon:yes gene_type:complete
MATKKTMATKRTIIKTRHIMDKINNKGARMQKVMTYIKNPLTSFKNWLLTDLMIETERLDHRVDRLENRTSIEDLDDRIDSLEYYDLDDIQEKAENAERKAEDSENKLSQLSDNIIDIEGDIKTIKKVDFVGIAERFNGIDERVNNLQELAKKYLNAELQAVELKQERTEESLSAMQKLTFEICSYYGGEFDLNDFNNCYEIINKYNVDVKEGK